MVRVFIVQADLKELGCGAIRSSGPENQEHAMLLKIKHLEIVKANIGFLLMGESGVTRDTYGQWLQARKLSYLSL